MKNEVRDAYAWMEELLPAQRPPVVVALNKVDLLEEGLLGDRAASRVGTLEDCVERTKASCPSACASWPVSGLAKDNIDTLAQTLASNLPPSNYLYDPDFFTDRPQRFFVGEIIREQILGSSPVEIPYSCEVRVDRFKERMKDDRPFVAIDAVVLVARDSQKGILIGKRGRGIRDLALRGGRGSRQMGYPAPRSTWPCACEDVAQRGVTRRRERERVDARPAPAPSARRRGTCCVSYAAIFVGVVVVVGRGPVSSASVAAPRRGAAVAPRQPHRVTRNATRRRPPRARARRRARLGPCRRGGRGPSAPRSNDGVVDARRQLLEAVRERRESGASPSSVTTPSATLASASLVMTSVGTPRACRSRGPGATTPRLPRGRGRLFSRRGDDDDRQGAVAQQERRPRERQEQVRVLVLRLQELGRARLDEPDAQVDAPCRSLRRDRFAQLVEGRPQSVDAHTLVTTSAAFFKNLQGVLSHPRARGTSPLKNV